MRRKISLPIYYILSLDSETLLGPIGFMLAPLFYIILSCSNTDGYLTHIAVEITTSLKSIIYSIDDGEKVFDFS